MRSGCRDKNYPNNTCLPYPTHNSTLLRIATTQYRNKEHQKLRTLCMVSTDSKLQLEINVKVSVDDIWIYMFVMSKLHIEITYLAFQIWSSPFTWKFYPASTMQNPKMMPDRQCCNIFRVRRPIQEISTTLYHRHVEDSNNFFNGLLTRDFESTRIKNYYYPQHQKARMTFHKQLS